MPKIQKSKNKFYKVVTKHRLLSAVSVFVIIGSLLFGAFVHADQFDQQIQTLRQQNASNQAVSDQLAAQASNYEQAIAALQGRISALQQAIVSTQHNIDSLQAQINKAQADLAQQKEVLRDNIHTMYLEGQISTLEILASSKDLSEFVDKEETRNAVSSKIQDSMHTIAILKAQLDKQQRQQKNLLAYQQTQRNQLQQSQNQQSQMLAYTQGQKAAYDKQIQANNARIQQLRAEQLAANESLGGRVVAGDPGHGGYPAYLDNAAKDSLIDPWGMFNRECVSYTAWKVEETFGNMPNWGGSGNANQWPADARASGFRVDNVPTVHSVAIWDVGFYGHAMWVEAVSGSQVYVSQYNFDLQGHYSEMWVDGSNFQYIHF